MAVPRSSAGAGTPERRLCGSWGVLGLSRQQDPVPRRGWSPWVMGTGAGATAHPQAAPVQVVVVGCHQPPATRGCGFPPARTQGAADTKASGRQLCNRDFKFKKYFFHIFYLFLGN